jgi:DNA invertase Pin-like site-specific DNA recombinase
MLLGYARVSKGDDQTNTLQAKALRAAGCQRLFEEAASGGRWDRPELHRMLDQLREKGHRGCLETRSPLALAERCAAHHGANCPRLALASRSITENIDTTTPAGRMMM